jgi:hypothetical protein
MPTDRRSTPSSSSTSSSRYDEIVRKTVPDPDTSWRPSPEQIRAAMEGERVLSPEEQDLLDCISGALLADDELAEELAAWDIDVEVERDTVRLNGKVGTIAILERIGEVVAGVEGVRKVMNKLVVAPPGEQAGEQAGEQVEELPE